MAFSFPDSQLQAPLTGGWEEKYAPGGWAYYTNSITKVTTLIDPRTRRYPPLFHPTSGRSNAATDHATHPQGRKRKDDTHSKLINQIFAVFSEDSSESIELRNSLDEHTKRQMEPRMRKILERRHREHFDSLLRKMLDAQLKTLLNPELRQTLEDHLQTNRKKEIDKLTDQERIDLLPLVLYIPAPDPENIAMSPYASSPTATIGRRWEDRWRASDLPFVALEQNSAGCHICLMDYDEPRRKGMSVEFEGENSLQELLDELGITEPEPLRLLSCGHVFHKSCVDPWILNESKDCPYCRKTIQF